MQSSPATPSRQLRHIVPFQLWSAVLLAISLTACSKPEPQSNERLVLRGATMGTTWSVVTPAVNNTEIDGDALQREIENLLVDINQQMSTYDPNSEISRFNQAAANEWFDVSPALTSLVALSHDISEASNGAFDSTVGPLVNLWGFGPTPKPGKTPNGEQVNDAKQLVGFKKVTWRNAPPALSKSVDGLFLDLSAIAKGYAVDQLAQLLRSNKIANYLVEIGGEMKAAGERPGGGPWRIGIERPLEGERTAQRIIKLYNTAIATSGDYRNYYEEDGVRYSHTINPKTGRPITHKLASVTVLAADCALADGLATALNVVGAEEGLALANQRQIAALFLVRNENGFKELASEAFLELARDRKPSNQEP